MGTIPRVIKIRMLKRLGFKFVILYQKACEKQYFSDKKHEKNSTVIQHPFELYLPIEFTGLRPSIK